MPIVPVVQENPMNIPSVGAPQVTPMRNFQPEQMQQTGAMEQQAGLQALRTAQTVQLRLEEQMDDANVKAAEGKFIQSATDILHGENGYMTKLGADAINAFPQAQEAIVKAKKDVMDSLGNDIQKTMFNRVSQAHLVSLGATMSAHMAQQRKLYTQSESLGRMDTLRAQIQNTPIGSEDHDKFVAAALAEIPNAYPGIGPEAKAKAELTYKSLITQDDVSRLMLDYKFEDAKTLLDEQSKAGNLDAETADRLRRAIRSNVERTEVLAQTDKIFAPYATKQLQGKDLEDMLGKVSEIDNPVQREQVENLVRGKFNEQSALQAREYRDTFNYAVDYKAQHGSLKGIDPTKWAMLRPSDQKDLTAPEAQQSDLNTWYNFITKPETLTLDNVNSAFHTGKLTKGDFKMFTERAMAAQKRDDYVQEAGDINGRINFFAHPEGIKTEGSMSDDEKMDDLTLRYKVQNEIDTVKANQHGKITGEQVDKIIKYETQKHQMSILQRRSWINPRGWSLFGGSPTYTEQRDVRGFQIPIGTVGTGTGSDGKIYYVDANNKPLAEVKE